MWEDRNVYDATIVSGLRAAMKLENSPVVTPKKSESRSEKSKKKLSEKREKSFGKSFCMRIVSFLYNTDFTNCLCDGQESSRL